MDVWPVLRRGAPKALVIGLAPMQLVAQMDTLDLSGQVPETVIPAEFDGGFFARIGQIVVDDKGIWVIDRGHTTVFRFGPEGDLMTEYGREGSGPGEFMLPKRSRVFHVGWSSIWRKAGRLRPCSSRAKAANSGYSRRTKAIGRSGLS